MTDTFIPVGNASAPHPDPARPHSHYLPRTGWINDPNGLIHWKGQYHLFFQHNPTEARWQSIGWGHAVSDDLVHWRHLPLALLPTPDSPDETGVWSGCAVVVGDELKLIYTASRGYDPLTDQADIQIRTASSCDGVHFTKDETVLLDWPWGASVGGHRLAGFRDPVVWREDGRWKMTVGAGIEGQGGAALLYEADDLDDWRFLGLLAAGDALSEQPIWTGTVWECPQLLRFGVGDVLVVSVWHQRQGAYVAYLSGRFPATGESSEPTGGNRVDWGDSFYAPQALKDEVGQWVMIGWLREGRTQAEQVQAGWSGVISFPRLLTLQAGQLWQTPHPQLQKLRQRLDTFQFEGGGAQTFTGRNGTSLELLLSTQKSPGRCGLILRRAGQRITLTHVPERREWLLEREGKHAVLRLPLRDGALPDLQLILDGSVLELFAGGEVLTTRLYPEGAEEGNVSFTLFAEDTAKMQLDIWELAPI